MLLEYRLRPRVPHKCDTFPPASECFDPSSKYVLDLEAACEAHGFGRDAISVLDLPSAARSGCHALGLGVGAMSGSAIEGDWATLNMMATKTSNYVDMGNMLTSHELGWVLQDCTTGTWYNSDMGRAHLRRNAMAIRIAKKVVLVFDKPENTYARTSDRAHK